MELHLTSESAIAAACGGAVLGASTMLKLSVNGNILGISGIVNGVCGSLIERNGSPWYWRVVFALGFVSAGAVLRSLAPATLQALPPTMSWGRVATAGALVGFGTSMGNGCTSGHGISGITRVSPRSIVATCTFMASAAATASFGASSEFFETGASTSDTAVATPDAIISSLILLAAIGSFYAVMSYFAGPTMAMAAAKSADHPARLATELTAASTFALALGISGMGKPEVVIAFLDVHNGTWNPTLAFVMGAALCITVPLYHLWIKSMIPVLNTKLEIPSRRNIDAKLLLGAAIFGVGWGLCGVCPGPALINIFAPNNGVMIWESRNGAFMVAMFAGTLLERMIKQQTHQRVSPICGEAVDAESPKPIDGAGVAFSGETVEAESLKVIDIAVPTGMVYNA
jgi:uncharacterized membrane protein YedE/YeeE